MPDSTQFTEEQKAAMKQRVDAASAEAKRRYDFWKEQGSLRWDSVSQTLIMPDFITVDRRDSDYDAVVRWCASNSVPFREEKESEFPYIEILATPAVVEAFKRTFSGL